MTPPRLNSPSPLPTTPPSGEPTPVSSEPPSVFEPTMVKGTLAGVAIAVIGMFVSLLMMAHTVWVEGEE